MSILICIFIIFLVNYNKYIIIFLVNHIKINYNINKKVQIVVNNMLCTKLKPAAADSELIL